MFEDLAKYLESEEGQVFLQKMMATNRGKQGQTMGGMQMGMKDMSQFANMNSLMGNQVQAPQRQQMPGYANEYIQSLLRM